MTTSSARSHRRGRRGRLRGSGGRRRRVGVDAGQRMDRRLRGRGAGGAQLGAAPRPAGTLVQLAGERRDGGVQVVDLRQAAREVDFQRRARRRARAADPVPPARTAASPSPRPSTCARRAGSSTSAATASPAAMRPVPRTQPIRGATSATRAPQAPASLWRRASRTSSAAFVSAYAPSPPKPPWLRERAAGRWAPRAPGGSAAAIGADLGAARRAAAGAARPPAAPPLEAASPAVVIAANGATIVGRSGSMRRSGRRGPRCAVREPAGERVDVGERGEVGRQDVQLGARSRCPAVQLAVPAPARRCVGRGRDDDGRAAAQQPANELGGDRAGARAGDERRLGAQVGRARPAPRAAAPAASRAGRAGAPGRVRCRPPARRARRRGRSGAALAARRRSPPLRPRPRRQPAARRRAPRRSDRRGAGRSVRSRDRRRACAAILVSAGSSMWPRSPSW